jgi:hypothetical protein
LATLRDLAKVVEAYTVLRQERRARATSEAGAVRRDHSCPLLMQAVGNGILGATHLLRRGGPRLGDVERNQLLGIIEQQSQQLIELAGGPQSAA